MATNPGNRMPPQYDGEIIAAMAQALALDVTRGRGSVERSARIFAVFLRLFSKCESPIETDMATLCASLADYPGYNVECQEVIDGIGRVDFCIRHETLKQPVVIECDGHEFHERTEEQARRDRKRDRDLQAQGYFVCRLTGHEIVSRREETAKAVVDIFRSLSTVPLPGVSKRG